MLSFLSLEFEKLKTAASLGYKLHQLRFEYKPTGEIDKIYESSSGREVSVFLKAPFQYRETCHGIVLLTYAPNSDTITSQTYAFAGS